MSHAAVARQCHLIKVNEFLIEPVAPTVPEYGLLQCSLSHLRGTLPETRVQRVHLLPRLVAAYRSC